MFKKTMMLLALAISLASTMGAMVPSQQLPLPPPPPGGGGNIVSQ